MTARRKKAAPGRKRAVRAVAPGALPAPTDALEMRARILDHLARLLAHAGYDDEDCARLFAARLSHHRRSAPLIANAHPTGLGDLIHMISHWYTCPDYLDGNGSPRALPFAGKGPSFSALVKLGSPEFDPDQVLKILLKSGSVQRRGKLLIAAKRKVIFDPSDGRFSARSLETIDALLDTITRNEATPDLDARFLESIVSNHRFPVSAVPALQKRYNARCYEILKELDNDLVRIERRAKPDEPRTRVGVGMFLFETSPTKKRRR